MGVVEVFSSGEGYEGIDLEGTLFIGGWWEMGFGLGV